MKLSWHGQSCVMIELQDKTKLIIDPWIKGNPLSDLVVEKVKVDYILITHGHNDHVGDALELAKLNNAMIISNVELADFLGQKGVKTHGMQPGCEFQFPFGRVKMTYALHSSTYTLEDGSLIPMGLAGGFLLDADNHLIYHAGDTALFSDMRLYAEQDKRIDYAFLPIGGNYTMSPKDAVSACRYLQPRHMIPIHYNTFELIKQDPYSIQPLLPKGRLIVLKVGEEILVES